MGTSGSAEIIYKGKSLGFIYFSHDGFYLGALVMDFILDMVEKEGFESVNEALEAGNGSSCLDPFLDLDGEHVSDCDIQGEIDISKRFAILVKIREWVQATAANILTDKWETLYPTHTFHSMSEFITWATVQLARQQVSTMYMLDDDNTIVDLRPEIRIIFPIASEETVERMHGELNLIPAL